MNNDAVDYPVLTRGLSKRYGRELALDAIDLMVPEGAVYVLIGTNGAGKSTTFKTLMNLERADSGSATVFGLDTVEHAPEVRAQIGYVPERQDNEYGWMTCGQLMRHVAAYFHSWDAAYAEHLTRAFDVQIERKVGTLSKGEARRLQLVLAMAHRPPLLLLDEPTDGLDPVVRKRALTMLAEHLADTPTTAIISTHQIYEVERLADHVGILRRGRLVAQMARDELHRTVRRYELSVPEGWSPPSELPFFDMRRSRTGREVKGTIVGEEQDVISQLGLTGAHVRDAGALGLEDAALAFLMEEVS